MKNFINSLFKEKRRNTDKDKKFSGMEDLSVPLAENGGIPSCSSSDAVDGITISRITVLDDGGLATDGAFVSRMTIDTPDIPNEREAISPLFLAIQICDLPRIREILRQSPELVNDSKHCGFRPIHHACNVANVQVLRELLALGAYVGAYDSLGNTALHLAVSEAWHEGIIELLSHGASPDAKSNPPNTLKEMRLETPLHAAVRKGDFTSTTLLLDKQPDLRIRDSNNSTILHMAAKARNLEIVDLLVKEKICQEMINIGDRHSNSVLHSAVLDECDPETGNVLKDIVKILLDSGADIDAVNLRGESPIFLAARMRSTKLVELLLSAGANPGQVTRLGQTAVHAACMSGCATSLSQLLDTGLVKKFVKQADSEDHEPFYYAVQSSSIDCCELLLNNGDHLSYKDKDGISNFSLILKSLPSATQLLQRLFDAHVRLAKKPQHDPDFRITFDYSVLLSPDDDDLQSSLISDLTSSNLEPLLKHPLVESLLYLKWQKIKTFFYISVFVYFLYLMIHTLFIILTFGHFEVNWRESEKTLWMFITFHVIMFIIILIPDLIILLANFKKYLQHLETYSKFIALASSAFVLFSCTVPAETYLEMGFSGISGSTSDNLTLLNSTGDSLGSYGNISSTRNITYNAAKVSLVRYAAATSSLFCWVEFMMLLGRFPSLGAYVLMFTRVAKSIIRFMLAFSSLLIGFALSFMVLFYNSPTFKNFPQSIIKTLMMMIGEIEYGTLIEELQLPTVSLLALVLFLFLVCIVMANLLIGLAVNDIPDLQRQGKIRRLAKQAAYLVSYEKIITVARSLSCFPSSLRILMASRCRILREITIYPNRDCSRHRYKKCLPSETIQDAVLLGNCEDSKDDFADIEEEDIVIQFKSFRLKYNRDRKILNKKLAQIPDSNATDKILADSLSRMQHSMEIRLSQLSLEIKRELQLHQKVVDQLINLQQQNSLMAPETTPQQ